MSAKNALTAFLDYSAVREWADNGAPLPMAKAEPIAAYGRAAYE